MDTNVKEQFKQDVLSFIDKNKDKLDKTIINILEKFATDRPISMNETIYLMLNVFMGSEEFNSLKEFILNANKTAVDEEAVNKLKIDFENALFDMRNNTNIRNMQEIMEEYKNTGDIN